MPKDIVRNLGPSTSQSSTGEAIGHAEDYHSILVNISPETTIFLSKFGEVKKATQLDWSWFTTGLRPPRKNKKKKKMEYTFEKLGSIEGKKNYQQYFYNSGYMTDAQKDSENIFDQDDFSREKMNAFIAHAQDIEYAIVKNTVSCGESGAQLANTGGIPYFMQEDNVGCAVGVDGVVTTTANHGLKTGEFVYFTAAAMPTNIAADCEYYVKVLTDKTFNIFDSIEGAVENISSEQVVPTSTGTDVKLVKNNVLDLGANDYTVEDLNRAMEMAFKRGGNPTDAFMSGRKKRRFSQLVTALGTTVRKSTEKKMTQVATAFESDYGTIVANTHRLYNDNRIDLLDMMYWDHKWFKRTSEPKNLAKTGSYDKFAIESWYGLQATQPKASASLINIKR